MAEARFFQFPIGCLHTGMSADLVPDWQKDERFRAMVFHACYYAGTKLEEKRGAELLEKIAMKEIEEHDYQWAHEQLEDDGELCPFILRHLAGASITGTVLGGEPGVVQKGEPEYWHLPNVGKRYVRIKADFLWDARNNPGWQWREYAVLCAIYAGIGSKPFAILSYDQIGAMAQGYNGINEYNEQPVKPERMTTRQIQWTVKKLLSKGFFTMVCPDRRKNYYSNRMTQKDLVKAVARSIAKRKARKAVVALQNEACRQEIDRLLEFPDEFLYNPINDTNPKPR